MLAPYLKSTVSSLSMRTVPLLTRLSPSSYVVNLEPRWSVARSDRYSADSTPLLFSAPETHSKSPRTVIRDSARKGWEMAPSVALK
jgi:hypothetical protein